MGRAHFCGTFHLLGSPSDLVFGGTDSGWVAFAKNSPGFALASAIVYTLGTLTLVFYFYFGLISTVLAYVAYALMLKAKKKAQLNVVDLLP